MKIKSIIFSVALAVLAFAGTVSATTSEPDLRKGSATAYCISGTMFNGEQTRLGVCAGPEDWIGKTIILYQRLPGNEVGELIGTYECCDKGGTDAIRQGKVVDIYCTNTNEAQMFMNRVYEDNCKGKVYIQVIDAEG